MTLSMLVVRLLVGVFFAGILGSAVVVAISFIQDGKELLVKE